MKMNLRTKLYAGFAVGLLIFAVVAIVAYNSTSSLIKNEGDVEHTHEVLEGLQTIGSHLKDAETGQRGFVITGEDRYLEPYNAALLVIDGDISHVRNLTIDNPKQTARIDELRPLVAAKLAELKETIDLRRGTGFQAALDVVLTDAGKDIQDNIRRVVTAMEGEELALLEVRAASSASSASTTKSFILVGTIIAILAGAAVAYFLSRSISNGVSAVGSAMNRIAVGDLNSEVNISSKDEIGDMAVSYRGMQTYLGEMAQAEQIGAGNLTVQVRPKSEDDALSNAFVKMLTNLRGLIGQVNTSADGVAGASSQLASAAEETGKATGGVASATQQVAEGSNDQAKSVEGTNNAMSELSKAIDQIAQGSQEQASSVERTTTMVNQVSSATSEVATSAQAAAEGARQTSEAAKNGRETVEKTVEGMSKIKSAVDEASSKISGLGQQSEEIGKIVAVIDDIAAQTNLLALNAAIEAARAGEQGRGFAVVADEVRTLAERVTDATKEIAGLIDGIQKGVSESITATEDGTKEVTAGAELADEAGKALQTILDSVQSVSGQIEQISAAAEQMASSADEMVTTMSGVSAVVEQNTAATEQMAANSGEVTKSMEGVAAVTQQSGAAAQQASAAAQEISGPGGGGRRVRADALQHGRRTEERRLGLQADLWRGRHEKRRDGDSPSLKHRTLRQWSRKEAGPFQGPASNIFSAPPSPAARWGGLLL